VRQQRRERPRLRALVECLGALLTVTGTAAVGQDSLVLARQRRAGDVALHVLPGHGVEQRSGVRRRPALRQRHGAQAQVGHRIGGSASSPDRAMLR